MEDEDTRRHDMLSKYNKDNDNKRYGPVNDMNNTEFALTAESKLLSLFLVES